MRLWAGFLARGLQRHAAGAGHRPLLVVLDCKGGADSRRVADRVRRVLREAGARSTAIWPDEASLSLWALPPRQLTTTLVDMIEHGTGGAAYYADVMEAVVALAVDPPAGPPASAAGFLARLDAGWLTAAYASSPDGRHAALLRSYEAVTWRAPPESGHGGWNPRRRAAARKCRRRAEIPRQGIRPSRRPGCDPTVMRPFFSSAVSSSTRIASGSPR